MSFFNELKRRNVFRVTAAYLALSWVITQVTGAVVPALHLPDSIPSIVVWLAVIGFPFVILFSWVYEFTPEGLKREGEVDRAASNTHVTSRRLDYIIIAMLAVAIGLFAFDRFMPAGTPHARDHRAQGALLQEQARDLTVGAGEARDHRAQGALLQEQARDLTVGSGEARDHRAQDALLQKQAIDSTVGAGEARDHRAQARLHPRVLLQETPAIAMDDKSIAVLPFVNMSSDKEQEYFSDGMSEELLNLLSQASDLRVIARTSSFAFKGKDIKVEQIAKELNVAHVLEGSVRKSSNTVRITAQLVRTSDSTHLWSETYDRPLDDIFKIQDEISNAIVQALQIRLSGGELSRRKGGTQNLEAYQLYLRGVSEVNKNTKASLDAAEEYLEQAIKLDPNYGQAWSQLSLSVALQADNGYLTPTEGYERARTFAQRALQLSPDLAEAHALLMYVHIAFDWDWSAAKIEEQRALAIDPTDPWALQIAGLLSQTLGQWNDAERQLRAALVRDPLNAYAIYTLGVTYYGAGRFAEAESIYRKLLELEPGFLWARGRLAEALLAQGKPDEALAIAQQDVDEGSRLVFLPIFLQAAGHMAEADEALKEQNAYWADTGAYNVARTYAYRDDHDRAFEWLERAYKQKDVSLTWIVGEPLFKNIADDPRFKEFLRKMNLPTE